MISEIVPSALAGERLDRIVSFVADISRSNAAATIAADGVRVDGVPAASGKVRLVEGQRVEVDESAIPRVQLPVADPSVEFGVVYEDAAVVVVDKPAALVVHPGAGNMDGTLVQGLLARYPDIAGVGEPTRPGIVHRLDAGSSGLLVVARTKESADRLVAQFASRDAADRAGRRYVALVWGHPAAVHGIIDAPIGRDRRDPLRMAVVADGRPARTEYWVVERFTAPAELARLDCRLETGRTHQIRVHLESIGHPLVGDPTYGQRRPPLGLQRPFLHAAELVFDHPETGERLEFRAELPDDLVEMLATLTPAPS
jgi:23S rRNA pseudouridine1911/1915/1917 synthase